MTPSYHQPRFHVIVTLGGPAEWVEVCLNAVLAQSLPAVEVTLFDDATLSGTADQVARSFPQLRLMRGPRPLGFAAGINRAAAAVRDADFIVLFDPNAVPALDVLERLAEAFAQHPRIGVFGCKVLDRDVETIRHVGLRLSGNGLPNDIGRGEPDRGQYEGVCEAAAVQTAAMAVRAEVWNELEGLDEELEPAYYEGIDFCFRAREAHWRVAVTGAATVTHFNPWAPRRRDPEGLETFFRSRARFLKKHYGKRDWLLRYLPDELRWFLGWDSKGMRRIALRALWDTVGAKRPAAGRAG